MSKKKRHAPQLDTDTREQYMVNIATRLAEEQILEGTASSQVLTHYLKLATSAHELEVENLRHKNALLEAKTAQIQQDQERMNQYDEVIRAFKQYQGGGVDDENL